jgi:hypothetical protein
MMMNNSTHEFERLLGTAVIGVPQIQINVALAVDPFARAER